MKWKTILSLSLVLALLCLPAFASGEASEEPATEEIETEPASEEPLYTITTDGTPETEEPCFSVTVPATLLLAMSEDGTISTATTAAIVNNSSDAVKVSEITVAADNGWTLVPYTTNMAQAKVGSKLIGFRLNGLETDETGKEQIFSPGDDWYIAPDSTLPLSYNAIVSAMTEATIDEQVLSVVFVVEWV